MTTRFDQPVMLDPEDGRAGNHPDFQGVAFSLKDPDPVRPRPATLGTLTEMAIRFVEALNMHPRECLLPVEAYERVAAECDALRSWNGAGLFGTSAFMLHTSTGTMTVVRSDVPAVAWVF